MSLKAVFLDRDKTILIPNDDNYIYRVGDFYIPENYTLSLKLLTENGYLIFIVTNQGRIAKGFLTEDDVNDVHNYLYQHFKDNGVEITKFEYCPHNPLGHVFPYNVVCNCRKPKSGLINRLIKEYDVDRSNSWMIGDSVRDVMAGKNAALKTILLLTGEFTYHEDADYIEEDMETAVNTVLNYNSTKKE